MPSLQWLDVFQGEDRTLALEARDNSNNPTDLTGQTVTWGVGFPPYDPTLAMTIVSKTGVVTDAAGGLYTVTLDPGDTASLQPGNYVHQAFTTDGSTGAISYVTVGTLRVRAQLWPA